MKNAADCAKRLNSLLRSLRTAAPPDHPTDDPIAVLVMSFLLWESTTKKAEVAFRNLSSRIVDFNDLRVCMPEEMFEAIGSRYPRGLDRCQRLRASLRDIYRREHAVHLNGIAAQGKREIRRYLDSLDGMVPYVASRVALLCFDAHAVPVDDQLRTQLIAAGAADDSVEVPELCSWLEHHINASEGTQVHYALQHWIDRGGGAPRRTSTPRKKTPRKTATKSKTRTKTAARR